MKYRVFTVFGTCNCHGIFEDLFAKMNRNLILSLLTVVLFFISESVYAQPLTADAGSDQVMCAGSSVTLGGTPAATGGGGGGYTYSWSPATGLSCTNCENPVSTVTSTTTYTLTVSAGGGNTDTDQVTVTVNPSPGASFTFSPNNQCSNTPVVFANTSSSGGGITYSWNFGNPASGATNTSAAMNPVHTFSATGNTTESFNVTLTVVSSAGCTATASQTVTVSQSPDAQILDPFFNFRNCDGSSFNLQVFDNTTPPSNAGYSIDWGDGTAGFSAGAGTFPGGSTTHTYTTMGIYNLVYTVTGTNGCADTVNQLVSNITNPAIGVANPGNTNGCGPITLCFPLSNYAGNHSSSTYRVNYGDGSPEDIFAHPPPAQVCHTYTESSCSSAGGAFTFSITARNNCDSSTATVTPIRVYTGPEAHFTPVPSTQCVNAPVVFNNTSVLGFNSTCSSSTVFVWNFGDGATATVFNSNPQTHTYSSPGNYTVTLSAQNSCGTTTESHTVCIEAAPVPAFTLTPGSGCAPLSSSVINSTDTVGFCSLTYNWLVIFNGSVCLPSSGSFSYSGGTSSSSYQPEFIFNDPGTYTVTLQVINSCGTFSVSETIEVFRVPDVSLNPFASICEGNSISPTAIINDCSNPVTSYSWTFPTGTPASSVQQVPGTITFNNGGAPVISITVANSCGSATASQTLTVTASPVAPIAGNNSPVCEGAQIDLTASAIPNATYTWSGPNGFTSLQQNPVINPSLFSHDGIYSVFATVNGCQGPPASTVVSVNPAPVVIVTPSSPSVCAGESVILSANGADSYSWSDGTAIIGTGSTITVNPSVITSYTVTGTSFGCSAQATATVSVNALPVTNAGADLVLCNQPVAEQLNGSPSGGTWSGSGITSSGSFTPSSVGVFTVTYTFSDINGCTASDDAQIIVNDPALIILPADTSVCQNTAAFNLSALPAGGTWSGTNISAAGSFNPLTNGIFSVIYSYGSGTCLSEDSLQITVNALPVVNAGNDFSVCEDNGMITLNGTPAGGTWTGSGISGDDFDPAVSGPGVYSLTYTYSEALTGCSNTDDVTATVIALPGVTAGSDLTLCNQPVPVTLNGVPAGGTWTGPGVTSSGIYTPNGTGTYTLTYTFIDPNGCVSSDDLDIIVVNPSNTDAGADFDICLDAPAVSLSGSPAGGTWTGTNITPGGSFIPASTGSFLLTYSFGTGTCLTTDDVEVIVNALPVIDAGSDFSICVDGSAMNLSGSPVGGTWSGIGITDPAGIFDPGAAGTGSHTLIYSFIDSNGCANSDDLTATVNALPVVDAGADTTLCNQPFPVTFSGTPAGGSWSGPGITAAGVFTPASIGVFTMTYTYSLATGCIASDTRNVTVIDPVPADAGTDLEVCHNSGSVTLSGTPAGGTWSGNFVTAGIFDPAVPGVYVLTYTYGTGNCQTSDDMMITVHALPVVSAGNDIDICEDAPAIDFSGTPVNGTWSGTGITDPVSGTFDPVVAGVGTYAILYSYTEPVTGCVNADSVTANVQPLPVALFSNDPIACIGVSELITNNSTGAVNYQWDFGDGNTSTSQSPTHVYVATGTYTIQLTATSTFGCVHTANSSIDVMEPPVALFTMAPDSACGPLSVSFTDQSSGQAISYSWDFGEGSGAVSSNPAPVIYNAGYLADTTYYVTLTVSNFCASVSYTDSVTVMPQPVAVFGTNVDIGCSPFVAEFANNSVGLPDLYTWDFGDGTTGTSGAALFTHTFYTGTEDTTYTITLITENECGSDTSLHTITVLPNQVNAFFNASDTSGCVPLTVNFTDLSTGATFISWDFGDGNVSTQAAPANTFTTAGIYTVQLFINDGCSFDTAQINITVHPQPAIDFATSPDSVCVGQDFTFTNMSGGLANIQWDFGDGSISSLSNPVHAYGATGIYPVTLTGTSLLYGCISTVTKPVVVRTTPLAGFTASPQNGCEPVEVSFINNTVNGSFYTWNFDDGNSSVNSNPVHLFENDGTYTVQLIATHANGCSDTVYQNVLVHPKPVSSFNPSVSSSCYVPVNVQLNNTSLGAAGFTWDLGNGQTSLLNSPSVTYTTTGTYLISLIAENQFGCSDTSEYSFTVYPAPLADFTLEPTPGCERQNVYFTSESIFATSWLWNFGDGNFSAEENPAHIYSDSGTYTVTLFIYGDGGCGDTISYSNLVEIYPTPLADFSWFNVQNEDPASGTVEYTNLSENAVSYLWEFGNGQTSTETDPVHRFYNYGTYYTSLLATNQYGCTDTSTLEVTVDFFKGLHIANAMYPGSPEYGVSNFIPTGVGLKEFHITIYDDWGNLLWECSELADTRPACSWDGTFQGIPLPQDAYVWKVEALFLDETIWQGKYYEKGDYYRMSGTVTIIR